jgi:hypothetical protein
VLVAVVLVARVDRQRAGVERHLGAPAPARSIPTGRGDEAGQGDQHDRGARRQVENAETTTPPSDASSPPSIAPNIVVGSSRELLRRRPG